MSIPKPTKSPLDMCQSTSDPNIAGVGTLLTALPHYRIVGCQRLGPPTS